MFNTKAVKQLQRENKALQAKINNIHKKIFARLPFGLTCVEYDTNKLNIEDYLLSLGLLKYGTYTPCISTVNYVPVVTTEDLASINKKLDLLAAELGKEFHTKDSQPKQLVLRKKSNKKTK